MTDRITNLSMVNALNNYKRACLAVGYTPEELEGGPVADIAYGMAVYVTRYVTNVGHIHDLPGFMGSTSNGSETRRQAYDKLQQSARVMFDIADRLKKAN